MFKNKKDTDKMNPFLQKSYQRHAAQYDEIHDSKSVNISSWTKENSVDAWRHSRMYQTIDPVLKTHPQASWLTVGDGRFGRDAQYISQHGGHALPTDISETLLKKAFESGAIQKYQVENAESLSFNDDTFDYIFCKESYHHFPRPMIGFYEMLRVSKKAVILIEPNDQITTDRVLEPLLLTTIIFKSIPDQALLLKLKAANYQLLVLPDNPYIQV